MSERRWDEERVRGALAALPREAAFPPTPPIAPAIVAQLEAGRARPALPGLALWSRRRVVVAVAVGLLAALAIAAAARLAIGAIGVRVQPGPTPTVSLPPVEPGVLGEPLPAAEAEAQAGLEPDLPPGPAADEVYVIESPSGDPGLIYAWRPNARHPRIPGTAWGQVLIALAADDEIVVKTIERFEDLELASVNGVPAFWIPVPHPVVIETERGTETFLARGNVLIWEAEGITYRLETTLGKAQADALAESIA